MGGNGGWEQRDGDGPFMGTTERESNERHILIEKAIMGLGRNLCQKNLQEPTKMTPVNTPSNSGDGACTGLL